MASGISSASPERKKKKQWKKETDHSLVEPVISSGIIEIDGSMLEGGGQILRNTVTLSCLLGKPVRIIKIRAGRSKPGLRPQHLTGIQLISEMCRGQLSGDGVGSNEIMFTPGSLQSGRYIADTKTAGSICLLIQAILPCLIFNNNTQVILKGGTNADMAPPIDYLIKVFKPMIGKSGVDFECILDKRGFYPKGGGQVTLLSKPIDRSLSSFEITTKGVITKIDVEVFTAGGVPRRVGHEMCSSAQNTLKKHFDGSIVINNDTVHLNEQQATGAGSGILITTRTTSGCVFGGTGVGNRKQPPNETGRLAACEFIDGVSFNNCVDSYLQDQLIVFMALAKGTSRIRTGPLTLHTKTAIHIVQIMTGVHFGVTEISKDENIIECVGIGYNNNK